MTDLQKVLLAFLLSLSLAACDQPGGEVPDPVDPGPEEPDDPMEPGPIEPDPDEPDPIPEEEFLEDSEGREFYHHGATNTVTWERPTAQAAQ